MIEDRLIIGGASGYWGEANHATAQLLEVAGLDVLVYDYLAEITLSIMARARNRDPNLGYATDFVDAAVAPNLPEIAAKGVKLISNAGGMNPEACAIALRKLIDAAGLSLKVGVVHGDDLFERRDVLVNSREMFTGAPFPEQDKIASINAYLGAFPIAAALNNGADIVVTGRCVDSALTLGAAIHAFGWGPEAFDLLAAGSLAGHLLECGPQATGGNFTDWAQVGDIANIGYPIAEITENGEMILTKPEQTTGLVSPASVGEQMLYEIGNPAAYQLPDVICDFSDVQMDQITEHRVSVSGAKGLAPTGQTKVSTIFQDGWRAGCLWNYHGNNARQKAEAFAKAGLDRAVSILRNAKEADYDQTCFEISGGSPDGTLYQEVQLKAAVHHEKPGPVGLFLKELTGAALAAPPGLCGFTGSGRPKPSPVLALFSSLIPSQEINIRVTVEGDDIGFAQSAPAVQNPVVNTYSRPAAVIVNADTKLPLEHLAWARSGDKGNFANIGIIARHPDLLPYVWAALDDPTIRQAIPFAKGPIERFYLPGMAAMNLVLKDALGGGGVASLLNDAQGKAYAQRLLCVDIPVPKDLI